MAWLLLGYQGLLLLAGLCLIVGYGVLFLWSREYDFLWFTLALAALGAAVAFATVGMTRRRSWGFLLGMACHLLLGVLGLLWLGFGYLVYLPHVASSNA